MAQATATPPHAAAPRARRQSRGRGTSARARSHHSRLRHAGRGSGHSNAPMQPHGAEEMSELECLAHKFCHGLYGSVRHEAVRPAMETVPGGDHVCLVVRLYDDSSPSHSPSQRDANESWRRIRLKLEAVWVLSVLACTESFAWRRNEAFWQRFTQASDHPGQRESRSNTLPTPRDDMILPRFLLDFSFTEVTADVLTLLRHVLMGSEKSMRHSFKHAMETLAMIEPRTQRPVTIPIALRFARCHFQGSDIMKRLVEVVEAVNHARQRCSHTTRRAFFYRIVELDLSSVRLSGSEHRHLHVLASAVGVCGGSFRLVLDNTITGSTDQIVLFGSVVSSWFDPETANAEPDPESFICDDSSSAIDVRLNSNALSASHVASLFSAIQSSGARSKASQLSLRGAFQCCAPRVAWAWVAFGVLCSDTSSLLESLDLSGNVLRLEDAAVVQQVIAARDSAARVQLLYRLMGGTPASTASKKNRRKGGIHHQTDSESGHTPENVTSPPAWVRLKAGTRLTLSTADTTLHLSLTSATIVRVVDVRSHHDAVVLVPGYGFLQVDFSTGTLMGNFHDAACGPHRLQTLKLNAMAVPDGTDAPATVLEALFSSVFLPALTHLELNGNPLAQHTLRTILSACPALHSLSLEDCELDSIRAIVEGYASGTCHIQSLNLTENLLGPFAILDLCRLMTLEASPAAQLRHLNLHQNPISPRGLHALSDAIRASSTALVHLVVDKTQDPDARFRAGFYHYHDRFLGNEMLSTAHQRELSEALARRLRTVALEPFIIEQIHAYAATTLYREIIWM